MNESSASSVVGDLKASTFDHAVVGSGRSHRRLATVTAPMHNESANLPALVERIRAVAERLVGWDLELLLVDDGSRDDSITVLQRIQAAGIPVGYIRLSRNFGHQSALAAGMAMARGDVVITMDADLQHPPEDIPRMLQAHEQGADVVQMVRRHGVGGSKGVFSRLFYTCFAHLTQIRIVPDAADFRLLGRRVLDVLNNIPEREKFLRGLIPSLGFNQVCLTYEQAERLHGKASFNFRKSLKLADKALFDFSTVPLKAVFWGGLILAILSFSWGVGSVIWKLLRWHEVVPGYTDIITALLFLGGCIVLSVGVVGRYLIMILEQVRGRPSYIVMDYVPPHPLAGSQAGLQPQKIAG